VTLLGFFYDVDAARMAPENFRFGLELRNPGEAKAPPGFLNEDSDKSLCTYQVTSAAGSFLKRGCGYGAFNTPRTVLTR
jgi:hypothetical protein